MTTRKQVQETKDAAESEALRVVSRWMQIIGVPIALALLFWQAGTTWQLSISVAKIETKMADLDGDRYSKSDAMKDFNTVNVRIDGVIEQQRSITAQFLQLKTKVDAIH